MIIYHNVIKGVFQYNLYPYIRLGQILEAFIIVINVTHADAHLFLLQLRHQQHGDRPPLLNQNIAMRPGYKGEVVHLG